MAIRSTALAWATTLAMTSAAGCGGVTVLANTEDSGAQLTATSGVPGESSAGSVGSDPTSTGATNTGATTTDATTTDATSTGATTADTTSTSAATNDTTSTAATTIDATSTDATDTGAPNTDSTSTGATGTTDAASSSSTEGPDENLPFVDITVAAGLDHDQGIPAPALHCLLDAVNPPIAGLVCSPERIAGGAAVADVDLDGRLDVFITRPYAQDLLYHNEGDGTFVDIAADVGLVGTMGTSGAAFGDIDNDGDQDLYVTTVGAMRHQLFIQEDGLFTEQGDERNAVIVSEFQHAGSTPAFADYDLDGDLDVYVGEWRIHAMGVQPSHARLLRNLGPEQPGYFEDVTIEAGIAVDDLWVDAGANIAGTFVLSVGWNDLDADGYPDLLLASDFATSRLFWNSGDGTFLDTTVASGVGTDENGMGSTTADYDHDGDFDWFVTSITSPSKTGSRLYRNDGGRLFTDVTDAAGVRDAGWGWGTAFFDHDLDSDEDLVATNGWYATANLADAMVAWTNYDGAYVAEQDALGLADTGQGRALVAFDADDDGDLEVLVVNNRDQVRLFRNDTPRQGRHWLRVRTPGSGSNRDGLGAVVRVETAGVDQTHQQSHEIGGPSHFLGHGAREAHFGLGDSTTASVRVDWPATGAFVQLDEVDADQVLVVPEP